MNDVREAKLHKTYFKTLFLVIAPRDRATISPSNKMVSTERAAGAIVEVARATSAATSAVTKYPEASRRSSVMRVSRTP